MADETAIVDETVTPAPLLLVGAGGHAASCIDVIELNGRYVVQGLVTSTAEIGKQLLGYSVIGSDDDLPTLVSRCKNVLIAVGHIKTPEPRIRLFDELQRIGCEMPPIVSPRAYVSRHATLGKGTMFPMGLFLYMNLVLPEMKSNITMNASILLL